ncbi:MAG TPA: 2-C-methyl-D-erythritol 2,4-cyclodiphosphate synthase, partial [Turneriella sp.]|nr:2-C-methyl-D-erythritol 2,4-cyclodiphosphate synthase [Turneriella sp.]
MRIGLGYDIHRTGEGDHVWLGGVLIAAPFSLIGHSDADVLLHAITDAILGAIADYDIGHH